MSLRTVVDYLRANGGEATIQQIEKADALAKTRMRALQKQGYVEPTGADAWRLTAFGRGTSVLAQPLHKSSRPDRGEVAA